MVQAKRMKYNALCKHTDASESKQKDEKKTFIFTFPLWQVFLSRFFLIVNFFISLRLKLTFSGQVRNWLLKNYKRGKVAKIFYFCTLSTWNIDAVYICLCVISDGYLKTVYLVYGLQKDYTFLKVSFSGTPGFQKTFFQSQMFKGGSEIIFGFNRITWEQNCNCISVQEQTWKEYIGNISCHSSDQFLKVKLKR